MNQPIHPGVYIRGEVIPKKMPVKETAKRLKVGRPALSNLLNGNVTLSPEMAARLEHSSAVGTAAYSLLQNVRRIPGTDDNDKIDENALRAWVKEAQSLCSKYGRAEIGDQKIGEILSASRIGTDGTWPCDEVRKVLEECGTSEVEEGFQIGVYNSRGIHARGEGGGQERALSEAYRNWSRQLAFEYPCVANVVEGVAARYDREAEWEDSEAAVRRRLGR